MCQTLPLIMMPEGKEGRIVGINAGRGLHRRLTEMGFTRDAVVRILRSNGGCLLVAVNGCRYALGRGMAMKILVEER